MSRLRTPFALGLAATLLLTVPFWLQWLDPRLNLWDVDDSKNHLIRLYHLEWLIRNGVWYPRWVPEMFLGYGYPLFNYYAPAFYYLTLALKAVTRVDFWDAFRLSGVVAVLLGASGVYAVVHAVWRRALPALVAALTFVYAPYVFAVNLYKRGDVPEALALSLIPWLLHAIWRAWHAPGYVPVLTAGGLGALLILTHNLTALLGALLAALLVAYLTLASWDRGSLMRLIAAGALALGLSAWFWMPAILEARFVQLDWLKEGNLDYRTWLLDPSGNTDRQRAEEVLQTRTGPIDLNLLYPHQLIATPKPSLGQALLCVLIVAAISAGLMYSRRNPTAARSLHLPLISASVLITLTCWALTFQFSAPLWNALPILSLFQFPWRFLGLAGLCLALAAGGACALLGTLAPNRPIAASTAVVVAALYVVNGFGIRTLPFSGTLDRTVSAATVLDDELRDTLGMGTTSGREFLPRTVVIEQFSRIQHRGRDVLERLYPEPEWIGGLAHPLDGQLSILALRSEPLRHTLRVTNAGTSPAQLGLRQAFFPGWRAWLDGQPIPLAAAPYVAEAQAAPGFLSATIPPGEHTLSVAFGPTRLRALALLVTLVTVAAVARLTVRRAHSAPVMIAAVLATLLVSLLTWRGLAPALGQVAAVPLSRSGLILNLAAAARSGGATLSSPGGPRFGAGNAFADVRYLTIVDRSDPPRGTAGVSTKELIFLHPPSEASVEVTLPRVSADEQIWFQSSLALDPQTWTAPFGDGVRFQLLAGSTVLIDAAINPRAQPLHRRWVPVEADLTPYAGQRLRLTLRTDPREELSSDWSGWGSPTIYVRHSARTRPLATAPPP